MIRWKVPPGGWYKINVDGSLVFLLETTKALCWPEGPGSATMDLWGMISAEHAEAAACKTTVQFVLENEVLLEFRMILVTDSQVVATCKRVAVQS